MSEGKKQEYLLSRTVTGCRNDNSATNGVRHCPFDLVEEAFKIRNIDIGEPGKGEDIENYVLRKRKEMTKRH